VVFNYLKLDPENVEYIPIAAVHDLKNGGRLFIEIDSEQLVVFNIAGQLFAIGDVCSHDNGPVGDGDLDGDEIICPRHGARFDIRTGKAIGLPAVVDIPAYPVRIRDGQIEIGMPLK
jgi:3-phenylpropionate/trans-cinnamate dioxygenase ferredoxin component